MKKNFLFYLLMMALPITFFSACGDDEKGPTETTWKEGVGAYKAGDASTLLKIDGQEPKESTKSVTLAAGTGDNAKITLTNLVPDAAAVEFDNVGMTKSGNDYTFSSETTVGTTTITISGTLSGIPATKADPVAKTLDIKFARKINSPIANTWKLNFTERGADVFFDVSTGDPANDVVITQLLGTGLGAMLAQKVSKVTAVFTENGIFDVTWISQGETESTGMPPVAREMVGDIMYFASEEQVFITLNKALIPMLEIMASAQNIDISTLLPKIIDKGDYAAFPLNIAIKSIPTAVSIDPAVVSFFIEKDMVLAALPLITPMLSNLGGQMPPQIGSLLQNLPTIVANSEKFNVGMNFVKEGLLEK
jgi:hypothetical protein